MGKSAVMQKWTTTVIKTVRTYLELEIGDEIQWLLTEDGEIIVRKVK